MKFNVLGAALCAASLSAAPQADAYPIDCAILLCLAGGFPASAECTAAKVEMIRRVTPWPVEPPLQLWNCPMQASGLPPVPGMGSDGLTDEIRGYRDGIEIYHIRYSRSRNSGGEEINDNSQRGFYDTSGDFHWATSSLDAAPLWVAQAVGGRRPPASIRAMAIRTMDHEGNHSVELVRY